MVDCVSYIIHSHAGNPSAAKNGRVKYFSLLCFHLAHPHLCCHRLGKLPQLVDQRLVPPTHSPTHSPTHPLTHSTTHPPNPSLYVSDGFKYAKASSTSPGAPAMWGICKKQAGDGGALGCLYSSKKKTTPVELELPSEGVFYCIPFGGTGGTSNCCASPKNKTSIVNQD